MFSDFQPVPMDETFALLSEFQADPRPNKVNMGIGIYQNSERQTPVFNAVREAELKVFMGQTTKSYLGLEGNQSFCDLLLQLVLGDSHPGARLRAIPSVGGSGALSILLRLIGQREGGRRVWIGNPSWPPHASISRAAGLTPCFYPHVATPDGGLDLPRAYAALQAAQPGDLIIIHACCHNPTGVDMTFAQWEQFSCFIAEHGLLPVIDISYLGLGNGIEADARGLRHLVGKVPECMLAITCSKSFGIYRERTGIAALVARDERQAEAALSNLYTQVRNTYSMPSDHGAAVVQAILDNGALQGMWLTELEIMRRRIHDLRRRLTAALVNLPCGTGYQAIANQTGMFCLLDLSRQQIDGLKQQHAIYIPGNSRINISALSKNSINLLAETLTA